MAITAARRRRGHHFPKNEEVTTVFGSRRIRVTALVAVLVGVAGLSYMLTKAAAPAAADQPAAPGALVEFTPDGKLNRASLAHYASA
jgi:hypothetical protein